MRTWLGRRRSAARFAPGTRVLLALGSGAARGWAHIGVIRALREHGLQITGLAGASMGALVGGIYASGRIEELAEVACELDWRSLLYLFWDTALPRAGLLDGHKLTAFIQQYLPLDRIEHLSIPFRAVAANVLTGEEIVFERGELLEAIRASISIPGIFTPVASDGDFLVDGGIVNPLPVSVARGLGADPVIAVDVNHFAPQAPAPEEEEEETAAAPNAAAPPAGVSARLSAEAQRIVGLVQERLRARWPQLEALRRRYDRPDQPGFFDVVGNSIRIMESRIAASRLATEPPDLLIRPRLSDIRFMEFHRAELCIRRGYEAAQAALAHK